ncbi:SEC-C metal-binding domain-containing protein [Nocardiopsis salina]|uniref:SEC-C metal-binding domain-containing protein n=1 Tax=Nocardiopsis salina TaxID=245836 RepID=UPI0003473D7D|nr:SEC-C metal-binding domain-containing protein [Nocardiopsis salina]
MSTNVFSPKHPSDPSGAALLRAVRAIEMDASVTEEVEACPDAVGEILLDEAARLNSIGKTQEAVVVLDALIHHAPLVDDRQYAAIQKLDHLRGEDGQVSAEAERVVAQLLQPSILQEGPAHLLGEALEEFGDLESALTCFNVASRKYLSGPAEDLEDAHLMLAFELAGRTRVRKQLGYAPDDFDIALNEISGPDRSLTRGMRGSGEGLDGSVFDDRDFDGVEPPLHNPGTGKALRVVCRREEFETAREQGVVKDTGADPGSDGGADAYFRYVERGLREQARLNPEVVWYLVRFSVEEIEDYAHRSGGDPGDDELQAEWGEVVPPDDHRASVWPPERNDPCWCGSKRKYKKCCGSAANR